MALKTVTGKLTNAANVPIGYAKVSATLSAQAVITSTQEIASTVPVLDQTRADGTWSLSLESNLDLTPNTTYYTIAAGDWSATVVVPQTAGPFKVEDIMAAPPAVSPPAALDSQVVHLALPETITGVKRFSAAPFFDAGLATTSELQWGNGIYHVESPLNPSGAALTNGTDAVASIQAAIDAAKAYGRGRVVLAGPYTLVATSFPGGGSKFHLSITGDNLTIEWLPGASLTSAVDAEVFLVHGGGKTNGISTWATNRYVDATVYAISAVGKGAKTVTCTTPAQAANFAIGDWIFIKTGELLTAFQSPPPEPDSELNQVISVNAGTGVIGLRWATAKPYVQEYWQAGPVGPTVASDQGAGSAPFGIANVTDRTLQNIRFIKPRISTTTTSFPAVAGGQIYNLTVEAGLIDTAAYCWSSGNYRQVIFDKTVARCSGDGFYHFAAATGSTDILFNDVTIVAPAGVGQIHIHEGSAQVRVRGGRILNGGSATTTNCISIRARAYDIEIDNPFILNGGTSNGGPMIYVDSTCGGSGMGGRIRASLAGSAAGSISVAATAGWIVDRSPEFGSAVGGQSVAAGNDWADGTIFLPPSALNTHTGTPTLVNTGGNRVPVWDFATAVTTAMGATVQVPRQWQQFSLTVLWVNETAGAGNVSFSSFTWNTSIGTALSAPATQTLANALIVAAAGQYVITATQMPTLANLTTPDWTGLRITRTGGGADTLAGAIGILGLLLTRTK